MITTLEQLATASPTQLRSYSNYLPQKIFTSLVLSTLFTEIAPSTEEFGFRLDEIPEISKRLKQFIKERHTYMTPNLFSPEAALTGLLKPLLDLLGDLHLEFLPSDVSGEDTPMWSLQPNPLLPLLGIANAIDDAHRRATQGLLNYAKALQYLTKYDASAATALRKAISVTSLPSSHKTLPALLFRRFFPGDFCTIWAHFRKRLFFRSYFLPR